MDTPRKRTALRPAAALLAATMGGALLTGAGDDRVQVGAEFTSDRTSSTASLTGSPVPANTKLVATAVDSGHIIAVPVGGGPSVVVPLEAVHRGAEPEPAERKEPGCSDANFTLDRAALASLSSLPPAPPARDPASAPSSPSAAPGASRGDDAPPYRGAYPYYDREGRGAAPTAQQNNQVLTTLGSASGIADAARGIEIVQAATASRQAFAQAAADDSRALSAPYRDLSTEQLGGYLRRAQGALGDAINTIEGAQQSALDAAERARFRNLYMNAADKAALGLDAIEQDKQRENTLGSESPFNGLLAQGGKEANPLAKLPALAELFGSRLPDSQNAISNDALVNRLVMLNGLPAEMQAEMLRRLSLLQQTQFTRADGRKVTLPLVHNGYIFGGGGRATDCSAFVSAALPADVRKGRFTTLDFRQMWVYQRTGRFPNPPKYPAERAALVKASALSFSALDLEGGDALGVGDLLIYRVPALPAGHIFIVRSYNPVTMIAEVIEASQSAGGVRVRDFPLSVEPMDAKVRYLRPGLMALRLKPTNNKGCAYADHKGAGPRGPASAPRKGGAR